LKNFIDSGKTLILPTEKIPDDTSFIEDLTNAEWELMGAVRKFNGIYTKWMLNDEGEN
jgi:hypothetical protein|tara:strand:+ start:2013 stop:2186 length:174 start_codon:yes stop_codon:yes gene_type:complete